jgi:hypothetical protein
MNSIRIMEAKVPSLRFPHYRRNAPLYIARTVLFRLSMVFRNEGLVVSSLITSLGVSNTVLSLFPLLRRFGTTLPQIILTTRMRRLRCKKWSFSGAALAFGLLWIVLGVILNRCTASIPATALVIILACVYFFTMLILSVYFFTGQLLRAKLIPPNRRGIIQTLAFFIGTPLAILISYTAVRPILLERDETVSVYGLLFIFSGLLFCLSAVFTLMYREEEDMTDETPSPFLRDFWGLFCSDSDFRRLVVVRGGIFVSISCAPFFTAYGRQISEAAEVSWEGLIGLSLIGLQIGRLLGTAVTGVLADRFGNRLPLFLSLVSGFLWPITALVSGLLIVRGVVGVEVYVCVYFVQGLFQTAIYLSSNYLLEAPALQQLPTYLASGNLVRIIPVLVLPLFGVLADFAGLKIVLIILALIFVVLVVMVFRMREPRISSGISAKFMEID